MINSAYIKAKFPYFIALIGIGLGYNFINNLPLYNEWMFLIAASMALITVPSCCLKFKLRSVSGKYVYYITAIIAICLQYGYLWYIGSISGLYCIKLFILSSLFVIIVDTAAHTEVSNR